MNNSQVKVPRYYRENSLIIPFSMLCPGISQNTKLHHLTLYKGQVWGEKSYLELCNHNVLNILHDVANFYQDMETESGELNLPEDFYGFLKGKSKIPYDTEILQSFFELTNTTKYTIETWGYVGDGKKKPASCG